jgi:hypothetical protein
MAGADVSPAQLAESPALNQRMPVDCFWNFPNQTAVPPSDYLD